jgi:hypothetical protein
MSKTKRPPTQLFWATPGQAKEAFVVVKTPIKAENNRSKKRFF